jgi:hypothetical protein
MYQPSGLRHALYGVRPLILRGLRILQEASSQDKEATGTPARTGARTLPKQDEEALHRLLSRTESELSDPEAVQRRETIVHLKLAAASARAEGDLEPPDAP